MYGYDVRAFIIEELTPQVYREQAYTSNPILRGSGTMSDWNGIRMHHLDAHQLEDGTWIAAVDGVGRWREFGLGLFGSREARRIGPSLAIRSPYHNNRSADVQIRIPTD